QAQMGPGPPGVGRLVNAIAEARRVPEGGLAAADIDGVGSGGSHGERTDRGDRLIVEDGLPHATAVAGLPEPAIHGAGVELLWPSGHARHGVGPPAADGAEQAPAKPG